MTFVCVRACVAGVAASLMQACLPSTQLKSERRLHDLQMLGRGGGAVADAVQGARAGAGASGAGEGQEVEGVGKASLPPSLPSAPSPKRKVILHLYCILVKKSSPPNFAAAAALSLARARSPR